MEGKTEKFVGIIKDFVKSWDLSDRLDGFLQVRLRDPRLF